MGRLVSRIDPDGPYLASGATIEYKYDAAGNRTSVRTPAGVTNYEYDEQNRLEKVIDPDLAETKYFYDAAGNLERTQLPNGVVEIRNYDELNRLKWLTYQLNNATLQSFDYTLDPVGHRKVVSEQNGRKVEYEYDDLYRLTKETITDSIQGDRTISYGYDAVGNRLSKTDSVAGVTSYTYDDNDRLLREELWQNNAIVGSVEYGYDDNGNTRTRTKKDAADNGVETVTYGWNQENRLVGVQSSNGDAISYSYDADGVRVSKTVKEVTTEYLVDKNLPYAQVLEESVNDASIASYVYGLDLISQERGSADSFYLVDGLGSTRGLTDASGVVTDTYSYDAFGNLIASGGGTANNYLFAGEQFDPNLGDYYLRQRYYDTDTGRFTRRDTYEGRIGEPITLHKYLYGGANPVYYVDPSGYQNLAYFLTIVTVAGILASALNPFNLFGFDLLSDNIFSDIDPTRGGGGLINFDPIFDFVREAIRHRVKNLTPKARNVAVAEYIDRAGIRRLITAQNKPSSTSKSKFNSRQTDDGIHAEQVLAGKLQELRIPSSKVTKIYTEFEPCNFGSNNCARFLNNYYPQAKIYYSYPYNGGMNDLSRLRKYEDLGKYGVDFD